MSIFFISKHILFCKSTRFTYGYNVCDQCLCLCQPVTGACMNKVRAAWNSEGCGATRDWPVLSATGKWQRYRRNAKSRLALKPRVISHPEPNKTARWRFLFSIATYNRKSIFFLIYQIFQINYYEFSRL